MGQEDSLGGLCMIYCQVLSSVLSSGRGVEGEEQRRGEGEKSRCTMCKMFLPLWV